ncbi:hypothetical protein TSUD_111000 [Trifolium subterraneum]|uniref:Uncharacterized protein n=1 Tax=Trifolium subterraneum TaxID=3900 RepID=A0A2Z6MFC7_TRISU|nr:hypothetical protein TSUD_111000 [Trifolium subterraneum]
MANDHRRNCPSYDLAFCHCTTNQRGRCFHLVDLESLHIISQAILAQQYKTNSWIYITEYPGPPPPSGTVHLMFCFGSLISQA